MHMIMNNLDPHVAQFPQELVTYGGNGQVFSNWAQVTIEISSTLCGLAFVYINFIHLLVFDRSIKLLYLFLEKGQVARK